MRPSVWNNVHSHRSPKGMPNGMGTWKGGLTVSYKTKLTLTIQFSYCTPGIYPKELKTHPQRTLHVNVVALSLIAKTWKQPRFPLIGEWINCHTLYNEILFSTKNKLSRHVKTRRNLKCLLLCERSHTEKTTHFIIPNIWLWKRQNYRDNKKINGSQGWGLVVGGGGG